MTILSAPRERNLTVDGIAINVPTMDEAISSIMAAAQQRQTFSVCTLNLDHCVHLNAHGDFRDAYRRARFVTADGFPIVVLGRLAKSPIQRTTGADLIEPICEEASRRGLPVFFLGSTPATLAETCKRLRAKYPGLEIAGTFSPGLGFDPYSSEADEAMQRLQEFGAPLCFLALGSPKQEVFAARCLDRVRGTGLVHWRRRGLRRRDADACPKTGTADVPRVALARRSQSTAAGYRATRAASPCCRGFWQTRFRRSSMLAWELSNGDNHHGGRGRRG